MYFKGLNQIMWRIRIIVDRNKRNKVLKLRNYYKNNSKNNHIPSTPSFSYIKLLFLTIICCYSSLFHFISSYFLFSLNTFLFLFKIKPFPLLFLVFIHFLVLFKNQIQFFSLRKKRIHFFFLSKKPIDYFFPSKKPN